MPGKIVERVSGQPLQAQARQALFKPVGIREVSWRTGWRDKALTFSKL